ncbi:MAG: 1-(5-phosphoribosyl)-5-[(5-phosphoribosylamino)methylideneamino]imidazole-4-carboxamide isomerase [Calditrichaeota bacterium]|nr:1-(5-phosphoribosyl)-5-[(5-phosphoribosylamino)methylideneamino]imidazole-4-carboxamide isomerase [Calditrichota bacterium]
MIRIIPAIDIMEGKCVRLQQGDFHRQTVYAADPVEVARQLQDAGVQYLHLVDLDGARNGRVQNWAVLEAILARTSLKVDFSGGLKNDEDLQRAFDLGVHQVSLGSVAVIFPLKVYKWLRDFGPQKIILSADVRHNRIVISGWQEETQISLIPFLESYQSIGLRTVTVTDVSRDGMLGGPAFDLYRQLSRQFPGLRLVASGGVRTIQDIEALDALGLDGVIIGKALYEGRIQLKELERFLC